MSVSRKGILSVGSAAVLTVVLAACGSSNSSTANDSGNSAGSYGDCKVTSKANSIKLTPVKAGTLTVETTLPAQGWWNGTTAQVIGLVTFQLSYPAVLVRAPGDVESGGASKDHVPRRRRGLWSGPR